MFRMLYENKFSQLKLTLELLHWRHNYNTRKIDMYRLRNARLNLDHSSTLFSAIKLRNGFIKLRNGLPLSIRSHRSIITGCPRFESHSCFQSIVLSANQNWIVSWWRYRRVMLSREFMQGLEFFFNRIYLFNYFRVSI